MDPTLDQDHWNLRRPNELFNQVFGLRDWCDMRWLDNKNYAFLRMLPTSVINTKGTSWSGSLDAEIDHLVELIEQHYNEKEKDHESILQRGG